MNKRTTKELLIFFTLTLLLSWAFWGSVLFKNHGYLSWLPGDVFYIASAFVPSLVAILLTARYYGKNGLKKLGARIIEVRFSLRWYLYILLLFPSVIIIAYYIAHFFANLPLKSVLLPMIQQNYWLILMIVPYMIIVSGPLGEEIGWRGFALERLLKLTGPVNSSLLLGFVWTIWHLPLFFIKGSTQYDLSEAYGAGLALFGFTLSTLMLTVLMTYLFIHTHGSILAAILMHTVVNTSHGMVTLLTNPFAAITLLTLMFLATVLFGLKMKNQNFNIPPSFTKEQKKIS